MAQVTSLSFINDEGVREKREIVDAGGRTLIDAQEKKIAALEEVDEDFRGGPILLNTQQANNTFEGRNIEVLFEDEIANGYANAWEYLADRVDLAKDAAVGTKAYAGLRLGDFVNIQVESNTYPYMIGAFDYDKGCCDPAQGPSLLMCTRTAFPQKVQWNTSNDNNGTAAEPCPYMASNVFKYLRDTLLPKFPAEVRAVMKERIALLEQRYSASAKLTDSNNWSWKNVGRLWLPDEGEMYGCVYWGSKYGNGIIGQIPVFKLPSDRIFRTPDGERSHVWLRCVSGVNAASACSVYASGLAYGNASGTGVGVAPCFLVG
jgi:hypothetical protein